VKLSKVTLMLSAFSLDFGLWALNCRLSGLVYSMFLYRSYSALTLLDEGETL